jgi:signal transduction protein with GAF and PtsI domain
MECTNCLQIFETIGKAFNSPTDTETLLHLIARVVVEQFEVKGCLIRLLSQDRSTLEEATSFGLSQGFLQKGPVVAGKSVKEVLEGKVVVIQDCTADPRIQYPQAHREEGVVTLVNVPLLTRGQVIGVLRLYSSKSRDYTERELEILQVVASFCATVVVHNMFHQVLEDITTKIRN